MTEKDQRIALALLDGKEVPREPCENGQHDSYAVNMVANLQLYRCRKCDCWRSDVSNWEDAEHEYFYDYLNDLNAVHRLAHSLPIDKQKALRGCLFKICGEMFVHLATARQMSYAILFVSGKWK